MPYLNWETDATREKTRLIIEDIQDPGFRTLSGVKVSDLKLSKWGKILIPKLIRKAKMDRARRGDADADETLLWKHVAGERPLHVRRTLSQYYFRGLGDTQT